MYEVTPQELSVFVSLGFVLGVFTSFYLTRLLEAVHMWRLFSHVLGHLLVMCLGIVEDVSFLKELKRKQMTSSGFTKEQIDNFQQVDDRVLTNWKESVIISLVSRAPAPFRSMMPFGSWDEAMCYLSEEQLKRFFKTEKE